MSLEQHFAQNRTNIKDISIEPSKKDEIEFDFDKLIPDDKWEKAERHINETLKLSDNDSVRDSFQNLAKIKILGLEDHFEISPEQKKVLYEKMLSRLNSLTVEDGSPHGIIQKIMLNDIFPFMYILSNLASIDSEPGNLEKNLSMTFKKKESWETMKWQLQHYADVLKKSELSNASATSKTLFTYLRFSSLMKMSGLFPDIEIDQKARDLLGGAVKDYSSRGELVELANILAWAKTLDPDIELPIDGKIWQKMVSHLSKIEFNDTGLLHFVANLKIIAAEKIMFTENGIK